MGNARDGVQEAGSPSPAVSPAVPTSTCPVPIKQTSLIQGRRLLSSGFNPKSGVKAVAELLAASGQWSKLR